MRKKTKWMELAAGAVMLLFAGLVYAWSIFRIPLSALFPTWSVSQLSLTFTISMICNCSFGFIGGKLLTRIQSRFVILIATAMMFCGFFIISKLDTASPGASLLKLYIFYGVLCGGGAGMAYNVIISTVTKWFPGRTGFASGVLMMGYGFGGIALGSFASIAIDKNGLMDTYLLLSVIVAAVMAVGSFFIKMPDEASGAVLNADDASVNYTPAQMVKTPAFWCFFIWSVAVSSAGLTMINNAATIAAYFGAPAVLGLLISVFNGGGRLLFGVLFDKAGRKRAMLLNTICLLAAGICLILGAVFFNVILIFAGLLLTGLCYGGSPALTSSVINKFYGPKNYSVNFGIANFLLIPSAIFGPMVSSALYESSGGTYNTTFLFVISLAAFSFVMGILVTKFSKK